MRPHPSVPLCVSLCLLACSVLADDFEHGYCAPRYTRLCQGKGQHVACQFPEAGPGPLCYNYTLVNFNTALKTFVLNYINRRRQRIASGIERVRGGARIPRPKLMMYVTWDRELATLAQRLADQCTFAHDSCRATVRYPHAGQTVGEIRWRRSSESDALNSQFAVRRILNAWWGERRRALPEHLTDPFKLVSRGAFWGHFSQIAVWSLQAVGCGAVCHGFDYSRLLLVCDFSHTNMLGQSTLNPGPQVPCPLHTARRLKSPFPLLCAPVNYIEEEEDEDEDPEERAVMLYSEDDRGHTPRYRQKINYKYTTPLLDIEDLKYKNYPNRIDILKTQTESPIVPRKLTSRNKDIFLWSNKPIYTRAEHIEQTEMPRATKVTVRHKFKDIDVNDDTDLETTHNDIRPVHYKKLTTNPSVIDLSLNKEKERVRWQQHRDRPIRPGAYALLNIPTKEQLNIVEAHKMITTAKTSLKLDQEDLEQLFQDTGFKVR